MVKSKQSLRIIFRKESSASNLHSKEFNFKTTIIKVNDWVDIFMALIVKVFTDVSFIWHCQFKYRYKFIES